MSELPDVIRLDPLDVSEIPRYAFMGGCGPRGQGKTENGKRLVFNIVRHFNIKRTVVVYGSSGARDAWLQIGLPEFLLCDIEQFEAGTLEFMKRQHAKSKKHDSSTFKRKGGCLVIFDDCGYDGKVSRHKTMTRLANNGRHDAMWILMLNQRRVQANTDTRDNFDLIFFTGVRNATDIKTVYSENMGNRGITFEQFEESWKYCTDNMFCFCILSRTAPGSKGNKNGLRYIPWEGSVEDDYSHDSLVDIMFPVSTRRRVMRYVSSSYGFATKSECIQECNRIIENMKKAPVKVRLRDLDKCSRWSSDSGATGRNKTVDLVLEQDDGTSYKGKGYKKKKGNQSFMIYHRKKD